MRAFCDEAVFQEIVVQIPAYGVTVAEVVLEYRCLGKSGSFVDSMAKKRSILCGNGVPDTDISCVLFTM